jgi:glycosyltransferase involved in cell wall biosynthesis
MRIGIDARLYGPKQGGLGRYLEQLISHLEKMNLPADFVIFMRRENWGDYTPKRPNFKKELANIHWYGLREQLFLPNIIKRQNLDLMHFPHWNVPLSYNKNFVVTIHDLIPFHYPRNKDTTLGPLFFGIKQSGFKMVLKHAAKAAKKIITISQFSKNDISETLGVPLNKIDVTYLAPQRFTKNFHALDNRFSIKKPYALYVGVAYSHKNLPLLLTAWTKFCEKNKNTYQLVLSGKKNFFYDRLFKQFKNLFQSNSVIFTDYLDDELLGSLYARAELLVYPSLHEGFGLPPLEAMSAGIPVVTSGSSCLPEVLGDAAIYFDPTSENELVAALEKGFTDKKLRNDLIAKGKIISQKYDWHNTAKQTWEIYKNSV